MNPSSWPLRRQVLVVVGISLGLLVAWQIAGAIQNWMLGQVQHQVVADSLAGSSCDGETFTSDVSLVGKLNLAHGALSVTSTDDRTEGPFPGMANEYLRQARQGLAPIVAEDPSWQEYDSSLVAVTNDIPLSLSADEADRARRESLQARLADLATKPMQVCERLYSDVNAPRPVHLRWVSSAVSILEKGTVSWYSMLVVVLAWNTWEKYLKEIFNCWFGRWFGDG